jgi:hypothetical protein
MSDSREKFEKWIDNSRYSLAAPSTEEAMFSAWQAAIAQQPSAVVPEGLALVPAIATREIEDAIGRNRNLKASEIWEVAVSVASKNVQQPSAVVPEPFGTESAYQAAKKSTLFGANMLISRELMRELVEAVRNSASPKQEQDSLN